MDYEEMLKKAVSRLPKNLETAERIEIPAPRIELVGKQTVIRNYTDITKAIRRDPKHLAKFLFKHLAVPGSISGTTLVLQGKVQHEMVRKRITDYIKDFVKCEACGKLDTNMLKDGRSMVMKCESCGARRILQ